MKKSFTAKVSRIMKICAIQVILAFTLSGLCIANVNYAQVLETRITVDLQNVPFEQALLKIGNEAKVTFSYSHHGMSGEKPVSLQFRDTRLGTVLEELFIPRGITYRVHGKNNLITIKKKNREVDRQESVVKEILPDVKPELLQARVTGVVTEVQNSTPMPGVNIVIKGTTRGTTTDTEGFYGIAAEPDDVLVFSFIGYASEERRVGEQTRIDISLREDIRGLDEVTINAGYYRTTKQQQTGSIVRVEGSEIQKQPVLNPLAALQAIVPGMQVIQNTGVPGGNFTVRIRGQNSLGNGNDPLYIINGVPFTSSTVSDRSTTGLILFQGTNPLNMLNPADIESIEVLKDADATAIYGSRGANGVILITTKKGQTGRTTANLSYYTGFGKVDARMNLLNTKEYLEMRKEGLSNSGFWPLDPAFHSFFPEVFVWDTTRTTNWQDELIGGMAKTTDAQFSLSGGTDVLSFNIGTGYHRETTVFPGNNADQRVSTQFAIHHRSPNKKLFSSVSMNYTVTNTDLVNRDMTLLAMTMAPNSPPLRTANGELNWGEDSWNAAFRNPLAFTEQTYESATNNLIGNFALGYQIIPQLELKLNAGYTNLLGDALSLTPLSFFYPPQRNTAQNSTVFSENAFRNWIVEPQLNWHADRERTTINFLIGASFLDQISRSESQTGQGFPVEALMKNLRAASVWYQGNQTYSQYRYTSMFTRVNYAFDQKYILNLTARRDGSSRFGPGNQFANFGALGVAWVVSREKFLPVNRTISMLKMRSSYGITGNDQLSDYQYLDTYRPSDPYQGVASLTPTRLPNQDFAWETVRKFEAAVDFGFFEDRISGTIAHYINQSSNQLVGIPLPPTAGFQSIQGNFPAVINNTGTEVLLNWDNVRSTRLMWTSSLNLSIPKNKLVSFPRLEESPEYANRLVVGKPVTIKKVYRTEGVDPLTGLYQFLDQNEDGILNEADRIGTKFVGQEFYGGLNNRFSYKGFELDILIQFVRQQGGNYISHFGPPGGTHNQPLWVLERWQKEGDVANIQRYTNGGLASSLYVNQLTASDRSVSDASFVRLKNISLSYSLPQQLTTKLGIQMVQFFLQGQNLLTLTNYQGLDPEILSNTLPPLRIIAVGVNIKF